ncbi:MAG: DUF2231 domain-containing protein, partial [Nitriliruptorales bacterium]
LTDFPIAAYVLAAAFDLFAYLASDRWELVAVDAYRAATWVLVAGFVVSLAAALTGFWDWWTSTPAGTQAWRTANWHMAVMLTVTVIVVVDIVLRLGRYEAPAPSLAVTTLTVLAGLLVSYGATYGGSLVFDYGFNVENAKSTPVWDESEEDLLPGQK